MRDRQKEIENLNRQAFIDEKEFQKALKGSHLKVEADTSAKRAREVVTAQKPVDYADVKAILTPAAVAAVGSDIEELFAEQLLLSELPAPTRQYLYLRGSKHTLDFAWPELMIGVEVQGMVHRIKSKFHADIKKRATALLQGWRVLEVGGAEIRNGVAIKWTQELFDLVRGRSDRV